MPFPCNRLRRISNNCALFESFRTDFKPAQLRVFLNGYPEIHETVATVSLLKRLPKNCWRFFYKVAYGNLLCGGLSYLPTPLGRDGYLYILFSASMENTISRYDSVQSVFRWSWVLFCLGSHGNMPKT